MITSWDIYWLTKLDSLQGAFVLFSVFFGLMLAAFVCFMEDIEGYKKTKIAFIIMFVFFLMGSVFIPTSKEMAAIYLIPKISNNTGFQKVPENLVKLLNSKMEAWMEETLKEKKDK